MIMDKEVLLGESLVGRYFHFQNKVRCWCWCLCGFR